MARITLMTEIVLVFFEIFVHLNVHLKIEYVLESSQISLRAPL